MATPTYDLLDSTTLTSSASSVTFSSISQDYRDLVLVFDAKTELYAGLWPIYFNSDTTASNYNRVFMRGDGSSTSSQTSNTSTFYSVNTVNGQNIMQIMDYSATDKHKTVLTRSNLPDSYVYAIAGRWANTSAITSITLETGYVESPWATGSTFHLYGIAS